MKRTLLLTLLPIAGCGPVSSETANFPVTNAGAEARPEIYASAEVRTLQGEWRVAGIDGQPFDEQYGLSLSADGEKLWWEPRCAGIARGYRIKEREIEFYSLSPPRVPGAPTPPVCAVGLPPKLGGVFVALDSATSIERTDANGIRIAGGGHDLTLFAQ